MWYAASLLMKGNSPARLPADVLREESIVLIEADSPELAAAEARRIGEAGETEYVSMTGETVRWTFQQVERVYEIVESLASGTEVFSRFLRSSEAESLMTPFAPFSV